MALLPGFPCKPDVPDGPFKPFSPGRALKKL